MKAQIRSLLIAVAAISSLNLQLSTARAQTYNAEADFSITNGNPNGVWSYTWSSTLDSAQNLYEYTNIDTGYVTGYVDEWAYTTGTIPIPLVGENPTALQAGVWPPNTLGFHPGFGGEFSHVVWTAPTSGIYSVSNTFTMLDTGNTEVYIVQRPTNGAPIYLATGNVTAPSTNYAYSDTLTLNAGDQIDFAVGWGNGSIGSDTTALSPVITFSSSLRPFITSQPQNQIVPIGSSASFSVSVSGAAPLYYQWQMDSSNLTDGGNISGSDSTNLVITNLTTANAGTYDVIVSNAFGSVISHKPELSVFAPPPPPIYTFTDLHDFDGTNGAEPNCIVQGDDGDLYGTTLRGGLGYPSTFFYGCGTVFKLSASGLFTNLALFQPNYTSDSGTVVGFVKGPDGNFYGATAAGGSFSRGTIFRVTPDGNFTNLIVFGMQTNAGFILGSSPSCLILGRDGNLYGTLSGAPYQFVQGNDSLNLFKMPPDGTANYTFLYADSNTLTHAFSLVEDNQGNFYSVDPMEFADEIAGGIEKITPDYQVTQLVTFDADDYDAGNPNDELIIGNDGNIYGTTYQSGTVFRMTPDGVITDLANVAYPNGIIQATDGNFYGTTYAVPPINGSSGTVFKMTPSGNLTTILTLPNNNENGYPGTFQSFGMPDLLQCANGNLYGLTEQGGAYGQGMIYRVNFVPTLAATPAPSQNGRAFILSWSALPGQTCQVQYKTNLTQSAWINLGSPTIATSAFSVFQDGAIGIDPQRFYRVLLVQ